MASPLSIFRKYQYWFLVFLAVMLMVAFVIAPPIDEYLRSRQQSGGTQSRQVVVRWDGGSVREMDLRSMYTAHISTANFLQAVVQETQKRGGQPKAPLPFRSTSEQGLIETMLLAKKAEKLGVVISDEAVADYLDRVCDQLLDHHDFNDLLQKSTGGRITAHGLYERLRQELKAMYMQQIALSGVVATTPAKNLEHFNRMQERVTLEMLPLKVEEFLPQVTQQPSDADIQALYDKYKERYPDPMSPEPGFRRLPTTDFAFLRLNFNDLLEAEKAKVTEAEILAEYEAGLKRGDFRRPTLPPASTPPATTPPATTPPGDAPPAATPPGDTPPATTPSETTPPATPPAETTPPATTPPATTPPGDTPPGDTPPAPPATDKPAGTDKPAESPPKPAEPPTGSDKPPAAPQGESPSSNDSSARPVSELDVLFTAVQDPPAGDAPADPPPPAPPADPAKPETEAKPQPPAGTDPPAAQTETPPAPLETTPPAGTPPTTGETPATPETTPAPPAEENKPLEEVRDQIATKLARPKAQERRNEIMEAVRREMESYFQKYTIWKQQIEGETMKEPAAPKLEELATQYGLTPGRTGPVDFNTVEDTDLGKTSRFDPQTFTFRPFREVGFDPDVPLFRPREIRDANDTDIEYAFWKVATKEEYIPELKDIRDEVVTTWKLLEARKLAEKQAEELRKAAAGGSGSLKERLPAQADKVFATNEFSWLTMGMGMLPQMNAPQLSTVEGVDSVTWDFMKTVFETEVGQVNVVPDAPHRTIYVFTVMRRGPETDVQRQRFLRTFFQGGNEFAALIQSEYQDYYRTWYQQLEREMNVQWERVPQ